MSPQESAIRSTIYALFYFVLQEPVNWGRLQEDATKLQKLLEERRAAGE